MMVINEKASPRRSIWQVALASLRRWDEAASMTYDDLQDRRLDALQKDVANLRTTVEQLRAGLRHDSA